jgi:hypothetical protein
MCRRRPLINQLEERLKVRSFALGFSLDLPSRGVADPSRHIVLFGGVDGVHAEEDVLDCAVD